METCGCQLRSPITAEISEKEAKMRRINKKTQAGCSLRGKVEVGDVRDYVYPERMDDPFYLPYFERKERVSS